jgi:hypothetical protein
MSIEFTSQNRPASRALHSTIGVTCQLVNSLLDFDRRYADISLVLVIAKLLSVGRCRKSHDLRKKLHVLRGYFRGACSLAHPPCLGQLRPSVFVGSRAKFGHNYDAKGEEDL